MFILFRIGDINLDGFNDLGKKKKRFSSRENFHENFSFSHILAISAPFEDNGAVYIFLGSPQGLSATPSQRIRAPSEVPSPFGDTSSMFGYGLSKGVDIDSNGYRDIAIGSPASDAVYIFKSYPVVKVLASIVSSKSEIMLEEKSIMIKVCAALRTMTEITHEIGKKFLRIF